MNNKGQVVLFMLMFAAIIIIMAIGISPAILDMTTQARNATNGDVIGLDCANTSISDFDKATCVAVDMYNPYFIGFLIGLAGLVIGAKVVFGV